MTYRISLFDHRENETILNSDKQIIAFNNSPKKFVVGYMDGEIKNYDMSDISRIVIEPNEKN